MQRKPSCATTKLTLAASEDERNIKDDTGKSIIHTPVLELK